MENAAQCCKVTVDIKALLVRVREPHRLETQRRLASKGHSYHIPTLVTTDSLNEEGAPERMSILHRCESLM